MDLSERLEWLGVRVALGLSRLASPRVAAGLGRALGRTALALGLRRRVTLENLQRAFGATHSEAERQALAVRAYEHLGESLMEFLALPHLGAEELRARVELHGVEHVRAALARGRGAIMASGHCGNWEFGSAGGAAHGLPITFVVAPLRNRRVDREVTRVRRGAGIEVLPRGMALRRVRRALEANRLVCFMCDQDARRRGVFVPLFGTPASTPKGAAQIAYRLRVPFIPVLNQRLSGGRHRVEFFPAIEPPPGCDEDTAVCALLVAFNGWLETCVRREPQQYWWSHRRWKTRPPAAAPAPLPAARGV